MKPFIILLLLLAGCGPGTWWHKNVSEPWHKLEVKAWKKHGACSVVCDYRQGYMSAVLTLSPTECRCNTPQLSDFNAGRMNPLDNPNVTLTCYPDCKTEAIRICAYQQWRCPEDLPLP